MSFMFRERGSKRLKNIAHITSGIRDNHSRGSVGEYLGQYAEPGCEMSVVSAFFTVYAYEAMKDVLDSIGHMDFLFGEPRFISRLDPESADRKSFIISPDGLELAKALQQKQICRECAKWISDKVAIRSIRQRNFMHGKMYHIEHQNKERAILGSSNFTPAGLGLTRDGGNIELNLVVDSDRDRQDLKKWFKELWENDELTCDVKEDVLAYLARIYQNHSPEFIYYKTLFHLFENYLDEAEQTEYDLGKTSLYDTEIWKTLYEFQKDGVKGAINKILDYNGCVLADSVGLGKTYSALAVIKYFELRNERVLVLCPNKLRENWTIYSRNNDMLNPFGKDRFNYDVLSHTDLSRPSGIVGNINLETLNWGNYDLVVIDESHNFRNDNPGKKDEDGNLIRKSRYQKLLEDIIQYGIQTKVLLLSATPVNNNLKDLRNQLNFISAGQNDFFQKTIGIGSMSETIRKAQAHFTHWAKKPADKRKVSELLSLLGADFFKLLDNLTIARAREHIKKYYKHEMDRLGHFPDRPKPITKSPDIDLLGRFLPYDKISQEIDQYKLSLFKPSTYLKDDMTIQALYKDKIVKNFTQEQRENFLIGMMKVNFLKRLESSVYSFSLTLDRTIQKIEQLEERLRRFKEIEAENPDIDLSSINPEELAEEDDDETRDALEVGKKLVYKVAHLKVDDWLDALHEDKQQLNGLYLQAKDITAERDAKLKTLKDLIREKVIKAPPNKVGKPNRKVVVFTAFSDTAKYLYENLHQWAFDELTIHSALVVGSDGCRTTFQPKGYEKHTEFNHILTNFAPVAKRRNQIPSFPQEGEIDLLIATDCVSEGQNLQDCDFLINYDVHWNPVRIIQRFGRIDRIGSQNKSVQLVNFWPTEHLDNYIKLKHRVEARMALVDVSATQVDNVLQNNLEEMITDDLHYRDRQLMRLKDEVLDLEEIDESLSLTEFTLDDFRLELIKFLEANRAELEAAPFGLYTTVPAFSDMVSNISPGVIFCLRQKTPQKESRSSEDINPLHPYYLVYIYETGEVRFTFAHPKQILNLYRHLCSDKQQASESLCQIFDKETSNGQNMDKYDELLRRAVVSIEKTFQRRAARSLLDSRDGILPSADETPDADKEDFELITWLVIMEPGVST